MARAWFNSGVPSCLISSPKEEARAEPHSIHHWQCFPVQVLEGGCIEDPHGENEQQQHVI